MKLIELKPEEILRDFFFCFTSSSSASHLRKSIALAGIRTPVHVLKVQEGYRLVSGFKRIAAARELHLEKVPAQIVDASDLQSVFIEIIHEQLCQRPYNLVEKARIVGICEKLNLDCEAIEQKIYPLISLRPERNLFHELEKIRSCSENLQHYLIRYNPSLKKSSIFLSLATTEQDFAMWLADFLQLRPVELAEIITLMLEIGKRESMSLIQVADLQSVRSILRMHAMTREERIVKLKELLQSRRFPKLKKWQDDLNLIRRQLSLPSSAELIWDKKLEQSGIIIKAALNSLTDVNALGHTLINPENEALFKKMFKLL